MGCRQYCRATGNPVIQTVSALRCPEEGYHPLRTWLRRPSASLFLLGSKVRRARLWILWNRLPGLWKLLGIKGAHGELWKNDNDIGELYISLQIDVRCWYYSNFPIRFLLWCKTFNLPECVYQPLLQRSCTGLTLLFNVRLGSDETHHHAPNGWKVNSEQIV